MGDNSIIDFTRGTLRALGGKSFDRHVAQSVLANALRAGSPYEHSLHVSSLLLDIGTAMENSGTGGALWILPADPSTGADVWGVGHQVDLGEDWCEPFREMWENRTALIMAATNAPELQQAAQEWDHLRQDAVVRSVASLAQIDGAILMTGAPRVIAFGVICNKFSRGADRVRRLTNPSDISIGDEVDASEFGGSRHRSAIDFCCSHSPACAVVASHDGGITVFASSEAGYVTAALVSQIEWDPEVHRE
jgi:hypothetical protein